MLMLGTSTNVQYIRRASFFDTGPTLLNLLEGVSMHNAKWEGEGDRKLLY